MPFTLRQRGHALRGSPSSSVTCGRSHDSGIQGSGFSPKEQLIRDLRHIPRSRGLWFSPNAQFIRHLRQCPQFRGLGLSPKAQFICQLHQSPQSRGVPLAPQPTHLPPARDAARNAAGPASVWAQAGAVPSSLIGRCCRLTAGWCLEFSGGTPSGGRLRRAPESCDPAGVWSSRPRV